MCLYYSLGPWPLNQIAGNKIISIILKYSQKINSREFDEVIRGSQVTTLLEGVLTGAEDNTDYVLRSVHDLLMSSSSIESPELLVLGFEMLQV